jgi:hypothetical protein
MAGASSSAPLDAALQLLGDHKHLQRTKGADMLAELLKGEPP